MDFVAQAFASWLVGVVADFGRVRLSRLIFGTDQERALRHAGTVVVWRISVDLHEGDEKRAEHLATVLDRLFESSVPRNVGPGQGTLLEAIRHGIALQLESLADADIAGPGGSPADPFGMSITMLADRLAGGLIQEILDSGARGGPLAPLANQLNHDAARLQARHIEAKVDQRAQEVLVELGRLGAGLAVAVPAARHALPADVVNFTGRQADLARLLALAGPEFAGGIVRINAIDGMAGAGKTAFAVHAAHLLAPRFPDGQLFVRLHGHDPDRSPVEPEDALAMLLLQDGMAPQQIPADADARAARWRDRMAGRRILFLLDDASSSEQVRPLLPGTASALVLVTSRRRLAAMPEALPLTLDALDASDAAQMFVRLSDRLGLLPTDNAVKAIVEYCGYLPLAISLMAGQFKHHPSWQCADLAADLASDTSRLPRLAAENVSVADSFDMSYRNLPSAQQRLFRKLSLHRGPDLDVYAAAALDEAEVSVARGLLDDLFSYHLIDEPVQGRYQLHDLIRQHASSLAEGDAIDERQQSAGRLVDYYLYVARAADHFLARRTPSGVPAGIGRPPAYAPALSSWDEAVTWMSAERLNLHAAAELAQRYGLYDAVIACAAAMYSFLRIEGHWDQSLSLQRGALAAAVHADDRFAEAMILTDLGEIQLISGDDSGASASLSRALEIYRRLEDRLGEANALNYLGRQQYGVVDFPAAAESLGRALEIYRGLGDRRGEANALNYLGNVQYALGDLANAAGNLECALEIYRESGDQLGEADVLNYLGAVEQQRGNLQLAAASLTRALSLHRALDSRPGEANALLLLGACQHATGDRAAATRSLEDALDRYRTLGNRIGEANANLVLGEICRTDGDYPASTLSLARALNLYRQAGDPLGEANCLYEMGVVQHMTGDCSAAINHYEQALELYRSYSVRIGEAEALNAIGDTYLNTSMTDEARSHFEQALTIAIEVSIPLEEGRAREGLGRCLLLTSQREEGAQLLRQALAIYERIDSPNAPRVMALLLENGP
jgi:tetratricopeptide (TPR) repeat protein